ncbi:uncharacterized protein FIBRA_07442 [Fibroporia radiculosa]|uniref:ABM domain-containing protein n=1 Tax=Fibroporia radiculosa TaxID=599839 RepID=J4I0P4_9APHY|nr:uncharacterized protein FIBRA_07442 [Fibroporia radiculosa]CCM05232.1 predicted protein [Fibroporia radiculosa]
MSSSYKDIKGEIVLFAEIYGKPEKMTELIEWADKLKSAVDANEPGTLEYSWARFEDRLFVWERYVDAEALDKHNQSDTFKAFIAVSGDFLVKPPVITYYKNLHSKD